MNIVLLSPTMYDLTISLLVIYLQPARSFVIVEGVITLWSKTNWFGMKSAQFWRAFVALKAHARVISD